MGNQIPALYLLLAAVIGVFIGLLVSSLFGSRDSRAKQEPPREVIKAGYGEILRLWYSPAGKKILVEMEGGHYKEFASLSKEQQIKALRLAALFKDWVVEPANAAVEPHPQAVEQEPVVLATETPDEPVEPDQTMESEPEFSLDLVKDEEPASDEDAVNPFVSAEHEEADVVSVLQESLEEEEIAPEVEEPPAIAGLTITQQIDAVLSDMLKGTDLEEKGVRLSENPEQGVDVRVGSEKFEGIESVPYPQVRQVIRDAVIRWEEETESRRRGNE
jgi:hypothetical protein